MADAFANTAKLLSSLGGYPDQLVAIKLHRQALTLIELRMLGDHPTIISQVSVGLPRPVEFDNISRSQDMISEAIRALKDKARITSVDAAIALPASFIQFRMINLPYMSAKELAKEAHDREFWADLEPDIAKYTNPVINYQILRSSENDDLTRILYCYAEEQVLRPWIDLILASYLNPVFIENELLSLANIRHITLPAIERKNSQAIFQINSQGCYCIAIEQDRIQTVKLEISDFDLILLEQAEETQEIAGEFWDEVTGRIANTVRQALLYFQEEHDFHPFLSLYVISEFSRFRNIVPLLDNHLELTKVIQWNPFDNLSMTSEVEKTLGHYLNPSLLTTVLGNAMQHLQVYGDKAITGFNVNMLPQEKTLRRNRQYAVINKAMNRLTLSLVVIFSIFCAGYVLPSYLGSLETNQNFETLSQDASQLEQQVTALAEYNRRLSESIAQMTAMVAPSGKTVFLSVLPDLLPENAELEQLSIESSHTASITGYATSAKDVNLFQSELIRSGLFNDLSLDITDLPPLKRFKLQGLLEVLE